MTKEQTNDQKKKNDFDVAIVGAGPAGLFTALGIIQDFYHDDFELTKEFPYKIAIFEQGKTIDKRMCPAIKQHTGCFKCETCSIMRGVAGAGAFSDGKFPITNDFGGDLWRKCGKETALELMKRVDEINRAEFIRYKVKDKKFCTGMDDWPKLYTSKNSVYKKICTQHNLNLLDADIRHLGTDISQQVYEMVYDSLVRMGVKFFLETDVRTIDWYGPDVGYILEIGWGGMGHTHYSADNVVIAAGRSGSDWVKSLCNHLNVPMHSNRVDIGVRFECPNEIWDHITKDLYESKIVYRTKTYEDLVRTFCMNPSGYVVTERTQSGITVNGHAFEASDKKSNNTNFALLVSQTFTEPFDDSNEYGEAIVKLSNMLGDGVIVQRYGDLIRGKRSTKKHIENNSVQPTLNAEPGDLSWVLPKRILDDILEMIEKLDHLVPGMINDDNLLYGVEVKFYNSVVETKDNCEAEGYEGLYFVGDGAGYTHSLPQASANGLYVAKDIMKKLC